MKRNELVWRELVDAAIERDQRRWDNIEDLAFRAGVAPTTAAYALRRQIEIGAVQQHHAGFTLVNPQKALTSLSAARSIMSDALAVVTLSAADLADLRTSTIEKGFIDGGAAAAIDLLGGTNTVSDYSEYVVYLRDEGVAAAVNEQLTAMDVEHHTGYGRDRGNVTFLRADKRASRTWQKYTSFAQTYADLFATPGWQASEFRLALEGKFLGKRDWDQE